ncbi:MAG: MFS transporter [Myxococcota bacterium]
MDAPSSADSKPAASATRSVGMILFLVGAVQFVNILDFMMVMPLGPDFAADLGMPLSHLGWIGGSYTASAAVAGILGSTFLDRFDRRKALALAMLGLVTGTVLGGMARGFGSLMFARILAGAFGGPATSLSLSIVSDVVPPERRGRALGWVMAAFSAASVLGVPLSLVLSRVGGWRSPFFAVGGIGFLVTACALWMMPPMVKHLEAKSRSATGALELLARPTVLLALTSMLVTMGSLFLVIPNFSSFLQHNLQYPRDHLEGLYVIGGLVSFAMNRLVGGWVDRFGSPLLATIGTALSSCALLFGFVTDPVLFAPAATFILFMAAGSFRGVALNALTSKVPAPHERARYMSTQSAVQHLASAGGAMSGSLFLTELPSGIVDGMRPVCLASLLIGLLLPFFAWRLSKSVNAAPDGGAPLKAEGT